MRQFFVLLPLFLGGCSLISTAPKTGNELIDEVVSREGTFSSCVEVSPSLFLTRHDPDGPPGGFTPERFKNDATRAAAAAIAVDREDQSYEENYTVFGSFEGEGCAMVVHGPIVSGDFAFLWFMDPGGEFGGYAFRRWGDQWLKSEKVLLGWW